MWETLCTFSCTRRRWNGPPNSSTSVEQPAGIPNYSKGPSTPYTGVLATVKVSKVLEMYADGRMDVLTLGQRRFEILSLNEEKDYLQGEVEFFDDEDVEPVPAEVREQALVNYQALNRMVSVRNHGDPDFEDRQISFQLAQAVPDLDFLSMMLRERSEVERLRQFNQFLASYLPRQRSIERMKSIAPTNGHGLKPPGV